MRWSWLLVLGMLAKTAAPDGPVPAQACDDVSPASKRAIERGLDFLERTQNRDGSWGQSNRVAKTSLACLAFMAGGSTAARGRHAELVRRGLDYVLAQGEKRKGHLTDNANDWADVHNHGYALLFLAVLYGADGERRRDERMRGLITLAIERTLKAQAKNGGWGYGITNPGLNGYEDEGSCSVTQVQALRACLASGFAVPKEPIDRAVQYLRNCAHESGGFVYSLSNKTVGIAGDVREPSFAVTAAALGVLNSAGLHGGPIVEKGLDYLGKFGPGGKTPQCFYYYGHFYAVQAMMNAGGRRWRAYYPAVRDEIVKHQAEDGSWKTTPCKADPWEMTTEAYGVPHPATAFALIVLQAPQRCLPFLTE